MSHEYDGGALSLRTVLAATARASRRSGSGSGAATLTARATARPTTTAPTSRRHDAWGKGISTSNAQLLAYNPGGVGPVHLVLRGSRPYTYPRASIHDPLPSPYHASDPNQRRLDTWPIPPAPPAATPFSDAQRFMTTQQYFAERVATAPPASDIKTHGIGGCIAASNAQSQSEWHSATNIRFEQREKTMTKSDLISRRNAELHAASARLQDRQSAAAAASELAFRNSFQQQYEAIKTNKHVYVADDHASPFFLSSSGPLSARARVPRAPLTSRNAPASVDDSYGGAGLNNRARRNWASDASLRMVKPADARSLDTFSHTFARVMSINSELSEKLSMAECNNRSGIQRQGNEYKINGPSLSLHSSLQNNSRRAIFNAGNELYDTIVPHSKYKRPRFQPRAYSDVENVDLKSLVNQHLNVNVNSEINSQNIITSDLTTSQ